ARGARRDGDRGSLRRLGQVALPHGPAREERRRRRHHRGVARQVRYRRRLAAARRGRQQRARAEGDSGHLERARRQPVRGQAALTQTLAPAAAPRARPAGRSAPRAIDRDTGFFLGGRNPRAAKEGPMTSSSNGGRFRSCVPAGIALALACVAGSVGAQPRAAPSDQFNDSHFHLTNYIQAGVDIHHFLKIMGNDGGPVALFGIPLQQTWSHENSGDFAPTYYLQSDAPLYYYSFTDAYIAYVYKSLTPAEQRRFEPMITGFNPADMYAVDHIK